MRREDMADLAAFAVVVDERNFTRAATKLGLSQSALSQIVKRLEERLGVPLIARTTRSVAPTPAGERLWQTLAPMLRDLDQSLIALGEFRDKPLGTIRITSVEHAAKTLLLPAVAKLIADYLISMSRSSRPMSSLTSSPRALMQACASASMSRRIW